MATLSEKTKVNIYDVVNSLPVIISVVLAAGFVYFQGNANANDIKDLKEDKKEIARELKAMNETLTIIKTKLEKGDN